MEKKDFAVRKKKLKKTKSTPRRRTNNSSDSVTIESLPIEVLTHLLQYLSPVDRIRSEQVCKKWKNAIRDTWRNIHTLYIISTCNTGYHFRFPGCGEIEENAIHEGKYLFIEGYNLSLVEGLVSRVARKIRKFILDCNGDCYPPGILEIVSKYCRNIEVAELFGVDDCEVEQYREFFKHNKKLHSFKCDNVFNAVEGVPFKNWKSLCLEATDDTDWEFWDDKLVSVIDKSESLEECQVNEISEEVIQAIFKKPCLKSLHYRPRTYHNLEGLKVIFDIAMLNRLTTLSIPNYDLDCNSMSNLLKHCCNLERLGILGSTDEAPPIPVDVILALPKLQTLELNHARIKDDGLIRLTKFKNLLIADQFNYCTDDGFLQVIRTSGSLETLVIHETKVTIGMFKQLATESSERTKYLRITVPFEIYEDALDICKNSKISIGDDIMFSSKGLPPIMKKSYRPFYMFHWGSTIATQHMYPAGNIGADPFADAIKGSDDDVQDGLVHIRIQQRNGRKTLTTVQGLSAEYDLKKIVRTCKKEFACNGTVIEHPEYGEVLQLQGDQRENICQWLTKSGLAKPHQLKVHGF